MKTVLLCFLMSCLYALTNGEYVNMAIGGKCSIVVKNHRRLFHVEHEKNIIMPNLNQAQKRHKLLSNQDKYMKKMEKARREAEKKLHHPHKAKHLSHKSNHNKKNVMLEKHRKKIKEEKNKAKLRKQKRLKLEAEKQAKLEAEKQAKLEAEKQLKLQQELEAKKKLKEADDAKKDTTDPAFIGWSIFFDVAIVVVLVLSYLGILKLMKHFKKDKNATSSDYTALKEYKPRKERKFSNSNKLLF